MLRSINLALVFVMVGVSAAFGQRGPGDQELMAPRFDLSAGFNHINANAPPGQSDYFGLNGGYVSGDFYLTDWLSLGGEFTAGHANDISLLGRILRCSRFLAALRYREQGIDWCHMPMFYSVELTEATLTSRQQLLPLPVHQVGLCLRAAVSM